MSVFFKQVLHACALFGLSLFICNSAYAAGTPANTSISNVATLAYDVNGVTQPNIASAAAIFVVDNKVDLSVIEADDIPTIVIPGQLQAVTTFKVINKGNAVQDYALIGGNVLGTPTVFGTADTFDALACNTYVESLAVSNGYTPGVDIATFIDELAPDASKDVYVVCNIPAAIPTNQQAATELKAITHVGGTAGLGAALTETVGVDNSAAVDIVFADPATLANGLGTIPAQTPRDATGLARDAYRSAAVAVSVNKNATCSPAPSNCNEAKTGTVITYTITVNITGSGSADSLVITDPLPVELINPNSLNVSPALVGLQTATITGTGPYTVTVNLLNVAVTSVTPKTYIITLNATIN